MNEGDPVGDMLWGIVVLIGFAVFLIIVFSSLDSSTVQQTTTTVTVPR